MSRRRNLMSPRRNDFKDAAAASVDLYQFIFSQMRNLALSLYEWEGLPETCNARHLEKVLFYSGLAGFGKDPVLGWLSLAALPSKRINMYGEAIGYQLNGTGYHKYYPLNKLSLCRNNLTATPTVWAVDQYASRIAEAIRTADINMKAQRTPILIVCDEKQKLTMKNVYMQFEGGYPVIYGDAKGFSPDSIRALTTEAPYIADRVRDYIKGLWADFFEFLGVNTVGTEKRERLISDEVNANNQSISLAASTGLLTRQESAEKLADMIEEDEGKRPEIIVRMRTFKRDIDGMPVEEMPEEQAEEVPNG